MISVDKQKEILRLHELGLSARKIAEKTNVNINTVCRYIKIGIQTLKPDIDMTGWIMKEHGVPDSRLTVIEYLGKDHWKCRCECGNTTTPKGVNIRSGLTKSCGCLHREVCSKMLSKNYIGQRFNKLVVLEYTGKTNNHGEKLYLCQCDCGNKAIVASGKLSNGDTGSCGCLVSKGESLVNKWLTEHNIAFETQKTFNDLRLIRPLKFDFYLPEYNILIEYQGIQHKENREFGSQQREVTDKMKKIYCKENLIPLYEIWYNENIEDRLVQILNERQG